MLQILIKGLRFMKVVLVKSPKMLSGLLRLLFGIKKENNT
ncbi:MAG: stage V sporulation protein SpoVM [Clostridia bacterium]|nr:stage V sporulation protein SpoVM [Clostridia bacterium]